MKPRYICECDYKGRCDTSRYPKYRVTQVDINGVCIYCGHYAYKTYSENMSYVTKNRKESTRLNKHFDSDYGPIVDPLEWMNG